jgi:hypothetical protein
MICSLLYFRNAFFAFIFFAFTTFSYTSAFADTEVERTEKIKIAYLFHFSQFTEWAIKPTTFTYCVYEDLHFSEVLQQAYSGKTLGTSKIDVQTVNAQSDFNLCQLLYFPNNVPSNLLANIRTKPILTVGEQKNILDQGMIYLFEDNQKIRFFINNSQALSVGLKISSQLLTLSKEPLP